MHAHCSAAQCAAQTCAMHLQDASGSALLHSLVAEAQQLAGSAQRMQEIAQLATTSAALDQARALPISKLPPAADRGSSSSHVRPGSASPERSRSDKPINGESRVERDEVQVQAAVELPDAADVAPKAPVQNAAAAEDTGGERGELPECAIFYCLA